MASFLELLVSRQVISAEQAREAASLAEETGAFIGRILVSQGAVDETRLADFLSSHCTEPISPTESMPDLPLVRLLPERLLRNYHMVPLSRTASGVLRLAVSEPLSIGGIDQVKRRLGMPVRLVMASQETIVGLLEKACSPPQTAPPVVPPPVVASNVSTPAPSAVSRASIPREALPPDEGRGGSTLRPRVVPRRSEAPADWRPSPVPGVMPPPLEAAFETLRSMVDGEGHVFVAVAGPDAARDPVLRKLCTEIWGRDRVLYLDLVAHHFPDECDMQTAAAIFDGVDAACSDEEEERRLLRAISIAYSSKIPLVVGMNRIPKESTSLSRGIRLTLGLARALPIDIAETAAPPLRASSSVDIFHSLVQETIIWSEAAFSGASLRPLLEAAGQAFERGSRQEAVSKAATAVASRLSHLSDERRA